MAVVTELITKFGFQGSTQPLEKYNVGLGKGVAMLAGMAVAAAATGAAIAKWTTSVLAAEQPLINLSSQTGVAIERIQELQYIANVSNSSTEALGSSLVNLSKKIGEAGQKGSEDFSRLGISVRDSNGRIKSTDRILSEVGNSFKRLGLSMNEQQYFADALGIDTTLLNMLSRTGKEMSELAMRARDLGILTKEQTNDAMEYNDTLTTMRFAMDGVRRLVAVGLAPEFKRMAESFTELLIKNKDWIVDGIKAAVGVLGDFLAMLGRVWPVLAAGAGLFVALKIASIGWATALKSLKSIGIFALLSLIVLAIDDLIVAFQGGKSVIADFFQEFFGVDIVSVLTTAWDDLNKFFDDVGKLIGKNLFELFDNPVEYLKSALLDALLWPIKKAFELLNKIPGIDIDVGTAFDSSMTPGGTNSQSNVSNSSVTQNIKMEIKTNDPVKAGDRSAEMIQEQMTDAQYQSKRGGM